MYVIWGTDHGPLSASPHAARGVRAATFYCRDRRKVAVTERVSTDDWSCLHATRLCFTDLQQVHTYTFSPCSNVIRNDHYPIAYLSVYVINFYNTTLKQLLYSNVTSRARPPAGRWQQDRETPDDELWTRPTTITDWQSMPRNQNMRTQMKNVRDWHLVQWCCLWPWSLVVLKVKTAVLALP